MRATDARPPLPPKPAPPVRHLTPREYDIALLVADWLDDRAIVARLGLVRGYVDTCVRRIQWRLQLSSRSEIAQWVAARRDSEDPTGSLRRLEPHQALDLSSSQTSTRSRP